MDKKANQDNNQTQQIPLINCRGKGYRALVGLVLQDRYKIGAQIDQGTQGRVFDILDLNRKDSKPFLCIKFSENYKSLSQEIRTISRMRKVFKRANENT